MTKKYILESDIEKIAQDWQEWKGTTVRPLREHEQIYEKHFKRVSEGKAKPRLLVLGATPELRTLGHKYGYQVACVDRSLEMQQAMGLLTKGNGGKEEFVQGDWQEVELPEGHYDLIAGDDVLNMLAWPSWKGFLIKLKNSLKKEGYFLTHLIVRHAPEWLSDKIENVFKKYEEGIINNQQDLLVRAAITMYEPSTYQFSWQKFVKKVKELKETGKIKSDFGIYEKYKRFAGVSILPPQQEFEKIAEKHFQIISVDYASQFEYCQFEPVCLLKRRL